MNIPISLTIFSSSIIEQDCMFLRSILSYITMEITAVVES
jgi:hypothetical protein